MKKSAASDAHAVTESFQFPRTVTLRPAAWFPEIPDASVLSEEEDEFWHCAFSSITAIIPPVLRYVHSKAIRPMQKLITAIQEKYHPRDLTFTRVNAKDLLQIAEKTLDELDAQWDEIEDELAKLNLVMLPALPDVLEDEAVRIFRLDAPLTRVLVEVFHNPPTPQGDALLAQAIAALKHKGHRGRGQSKPPGQPQRNPPQNKPKSQNRPSPVYHQPPDPTQPNSRKHYTRPLQ